MNMTRCAGCRHIVTTETRALVGYEMSERDACFQTLVWRRLVQMRQHLQHPWHRIDS